MTNNDVLRRIRYIFDLDDNKMMAIFTLAGATASRAEISSWLKKDTDEGFENCSDQQLATFLNGFITDQRGKKDGPVPKPESRLSNNKIFNKLKIALNLKADDILEMMALANFDISKHELSAFFRKVGHKHYRKCKDQALRNFLLGMQLKYCGAHSDTSSESDQKPEPKHKPKADQEQESATPKPEKFVWTKPGNNKT